MADQKGSPEKDVQHSQSQPLGPGTPRPDNPKAPSPDPTGTGSGEVRAGNNVINPSEASPLIGYGTIGNTAQYTVSDVINKLQAEDGGGTIKPHSWQEGELPEDAVTAGKAFDAVAIMGGSHAQFTKPENRKPGPDPEAQKEVNAKRGGVANPAQAQIKAQQARTGANAAPAAASPPIPAHQAQHEAPAGQHEAKK